MVDVTGERVPSVVRVIEPCDVDALSTGRRVVHMEAAALETLADSLSYEFIEAVKLMLLAKGRVILSGMGKSGHIARKVAATLSSTGTPAYFVHPAEASHGDLGAITQDDVCLVFSNSGETAELSDIIAYTRRFSIPLIGVAKTPDSALLRAADVALVLPNVPEACAIGMAPTTSTTLTLALGDALAVAVMEKRGFLPHDFKCFHPGGKLGAQLLSVSALMHSGDALPLVYGSTVMSEAVLTMTAKSFGVLGVVDDQGHLSGVITDGDLRRHMDGLMEKTAAIVMSNDPFTIYPGALAAEALGAMNEKKVTCLFVLDERGVPVGLIHIHDCLRAGVV